MPFAEIKSHDGRAPVDIAVPAALRGKAEILAGRASVIDGDTIEIHGERVRFNGVDAPEASQRCEDRNRQPYRCGARAADALATLVRQSSPVSCRFIERDQYGRFVGDCSLANGDSLQAALVRAGWALDWPRHSGGKFTGDQAKARAERRGLWEGDFQRPWEWRAAARTPANTTDAPAHLVITATSTDRCQIKGNISTDGQRIYHVPGQEHYDRTRISWGKGEPWFCSEAEARSAGWRRSLR